MLKKIKIIVIVILVILSILLVNINSGFMAANTEFSTNRVSNQSPEPLSNGNFEWGTIEVISEPILGQDNNINWSRNVKIAVENDNVYAVWTDKTDIFGCGDDLDVFYRYFDGSVWSEIQVISEPVKGKNYCIGNSGGPAIAVENGKIYVIWQDGNNTNNAGFEYDTFYRTNLTGSGWEDIQVISEPVQDQNFNSGWTYTPAIAIENGKIYAIWIDTNNTNNAGTDSDVLFRCNLTGLGWEDTQVISEPVHGMGFNTGVSDYPDLAVEDENIYIIWRDDNDTYGAGTDTDTFFRCNISSAGWGEIQVISEPVKDQNFNIRNSYNPSIAAENGMIYTVWEDANDTNNCGNMERDIFFKCNLSGSAWEPVQVISEPVFGQNFNTAWSWNPDIDVYQGTIHVAWNDGNDTNGAGGLDEDIFYRCNLTGSSWEPTQVISEPIGGQNYCIGHGGSAELIVEFDKIHITWVDENNTDGANVDDDIFYRWIKYPFSELLLKDPNVTPIFGNTSTNFNYTVRYVHLNNNSPNNVYANIDGLNQSMLEVDPFDINYLDGKEYFYNTNQLSIGHHTYQFWVTEAINITSTGIFNNPIVNNTKPNIITLDNLTAFEDTYFEVIYQYEDIDRENIAQIGTWNYSTNASWLDFNPTSAMLYGTPSNDDVGTYWVYIEINDTMDTDFTNFTLTVLNVNDDPVINTTNIEITYEDVLYQVDYNASDIDSLISNQIWSLDTNATSWLNIDTTTGIISGIPSNDEVGEYWVNVSVDDSDMGLAFTNFTLLVMNVNDRPEIITGDKIVANANVLYMVDYNATDIDNPLSQLTWSIDTNATWLDIDTNTGVLSGTPSISDLGWFNVNITVDDGDGGQDWNDFILTVTSEGFDNDPPEITTIDKVSITAGEVYNVIYEATDDRTQVDSLTWTYNSNASWLSFNKITRTLSGNPTLSHVGWYWINVSAFDGEGGFDSHNFTLKVWVTANEPPDILTEDDVNAVVDELYSVDYEAEDDHTPIDMLEWSLETNTSDWLDIDSITGVLSGTAELIDVGSYWVKVSVNDGEDGWDFTNFTLYVTTEPITKVPPELSNPSMTPATGNTNTEFIFSVDYSHLDGDLPDSIEVIIDGKSYDMESTNGHYEYSTKLSEGNHTYYFTTTLGNFIVNTDEYQTGYIDKSTDVETGDGDDGEEDNTMLYALIGIIVVIIVVLILLLIFLKKKEKDAEPPVEEVEPPSSEEIPPEQVPTPEAPIPEQPPTPEVPPEPMPVQETPATEQPQVPEVSSEQLATPEVTPQVVPQVDPSSQPAPMPQVEEQPVLAPQVEVQGPQGQAPVPKVKQPTIKVLEENVE